MTVDATDVDCSLGLSLEAWVRSSEAQGLQKTLEERILRVLFSTSPDGPQFQQIVERLAWIGSEVSKPLIAREIAALNTVVEKKIPLSDQWKNDFDAPSKYAPNSRDPITGKPSYNDSRSRKFIIPGKESSGIHIGWINGVNNSFEDSKDNGAYLQRLTGGHTVCGIYNCSHTAVLDALEAGVLNYLGYSPNTAKLLQSDWKAFHEANLNRPNVKFLQVCHSQGAIHVKNALENLPKEIRDRVIVVAIAPATVVPKRLCFRSLNYASGNDFVYKLEPSPPPNRPHKLDGLILPTFGKAIDDRDELIILKAHSEAKGIDHEFQSRTFEKVLRDVFVDYEEHKGEYLSDENGY